MIKKTGTLGISECDNDRYGIWVNEENTEYTLHCGDCFQIIKDGKWINVRIEFNQYGWYLIHDDEKVMDMPRTRVLARI